MANAPVQVLPRPRQQRVLNAIDAVIESMERHTWYLDETLVILSLVDPDLEDDAKKDIAKVLLETPVPDKFQPKARIDILKDVHFSAENPPKLAKFVGPNSWFIFKLLDISKESDKPWLACPPSFLPSVEQSKRLKDFCEKLQVVNDCSECAVKLVSEFIDDVHDEDDRQDLLLAVQRRREQLRNATTKYDIHRTYEQIRD